MILGLIEIPKGSNYKYELDKKSGKLLLDRVLDKFYPANYGFILDTLSLDGDELDMFIYGELPIEPLAQVKIEVLGVIEMEDNGVKDEKIIGWLEGSSYPYDSSFSQICYFLRTYKSGTVIHSVGDKNRAQEIVDAAKERFKAKT